MCHSFRRGTMQMYQIREANSIYLIEPLPLIEAGDS